MIPARQFRVVATALAMMATTGNAYAGDFSDSAAYNSPFGMVSGQENQAVDPSLRDQNGNLSVVNGQFTSSAAARAFSQSTASSFSSGVGTSGSGASFGGATAIGNSLNVVTVGNDNTVIVNSVQKNSGNITATTSINGSH